MRDYVSDQAAAGEEEAPAFALPAIKFTLDGQEFRCLTEISGDAFLEWSELAIGASDDTPANAPEAAAMFARFLRATFGPEEYQRLRRHIRAHQTPPAVIIKILSGIQEEISGVMEGATGRPTVPSSPSSPGDGDLAAQRARRISLQRGDVSYVDAPPAGKRPTDHKGKGGASRSKRAAGTAG